MEEDMIDINFVYMDKDYMVVDYTLEYLYDIV